MVYDSLNRYWCKGKKCGCKRMHWVINANMTICGECMHNPCACNGPLVLDEAEKAYNCFFHAMV
jgi:hypothetical protein